MRRHFGASKDADDQTLRLAAVKTAQDEGYEADASLVAVKR
jgi:hypothetical protein